MNHLAVRGGLASLPVALIGLALAGLCPGAAGMRRPGPPPQPEAVLQDEQTALDKCDRRPDTNYSFRVENTIRGKDFTTYILDMTSQAWLTTNEADRLIWKPG